jgi:hypothetical protein
MILGISTPSIRDRRRLKLNSFTSVRCSPNARSPTSRSSPSHGGPTNSEFPMPRWLAVRGFTCLEVPLRLEGGNDSRNFEAFGAILRPEADSRAH